LLGGRFEAALLKGRRNYLCVRRFLHIMSHFEREMDSPAEMLALMPLIVWASRTESGDMGECTALLLDENALSVVDKVTSGPDECAGRACHARSMCMVRRARALAQLADLVLVNHALLFSEVGLDQPILPIHRCLILDEAHNLEDVATDAQTIKVDTLSVYRVTNRLWRARRDGTGSGMIATVMYEADKRLPRSGPVSRDTVVDLAQGVIERISEAATAARECFETLAEPYESVPIKEETILLSECRPPVGVETETGRAASALAKSIQGLNSRLEALAEAVGLNAESWPRAQELAGDLRSQMARLKEVLDALEFILKHEDEGYVYWLERTSREYQSFYSLHAAPLAIGPFLKSYFFDVKRCIVMTSATLRVNGEFGYVRERLGLVELSEEKLRCTAVGSPFDYDRQALVCTPTFLPDPGGVRDELYDEELSSFLIDLLKATSGRALVLFTSYSLLDSVYKRIKHPLERAGFPVLGQGRDGSREALSALFRRLTGSVLLGTLSFWEGVDFPGEMLSCLVMTKLPFHVFTEPLVQGRIRYMREKGADPFLHYTLPEAVTSFRQGFGRLIRTRTDRGVVVVTDRRLVTKAYGRVFLRDIPTQNHIFKEREPLLRAVRMFLSKPF
jgi:ATP-dependent DNA helicase DinG